MKKTKNKTPSSRKLIDKKVIDETDPKDKRFNSRIGIIDRKLIKRKFSDRRPIAR